ncbi:MAG: hypothetical protein BRD53_04950 [Bacteroidetes bacterium SW_7_64_58]|nr:MAG: hypothetical protein BRD53_04950 [Bacteroidetes bacterium SW_7_64_58]
MGDDAPPAHRHGQSAPHVARRGPGARVGFRLVGPPHIGGLIGGRPSRRPGRAARPPLRGGRIGHPGASRHRGLPNGPAARRAAHHRPADRPPRPFPPSHRVAPVGTGDARARLSPPRLQRTRRGHQPPDYQATDGDFPYTDESRFPPETVRRRNADRTRQSLYASVQSRVAEHQLRVSGWGTQAERGLPPTSSTAPARARQWDTQVRIWGRDRVPVGEGRLAVSGLAQRTRLRYADPTQDLDQTGRTALASLETTLRHPVSGRWTMIGGGSGSYARARHPSLAASAHQHHASAFVEGTGRYGRLTLYPALRTDAYWMPAGTTRGAMSPRLGLNWQPFAQWPGLHVKAQFGRSFRVPTFNDRYWQPGGNPDLRPERSWGGDLGIRLDWSHGHAEVSAFGHRRRDQITWQPTGNGYWAPKNAAALDLNARYTGRRYVTSDGSQFLEAYVIADTQLRLEHEFGGVRTELSLRLDNALDTDYESVGGRPMPPRHARLRLRLIL